MANGDEEFNLDGLSQLGIKLRLRELELEEKNIDAVERYRQLTAEERRAQFEAEELRFQIEAELQRALVNWNKGKQIQAEREIALRSGKGSPGTGLLAAGEGGSALVTPEERNLTGWNTVLKAIAPSVTERGANFPLFSRSVENIFEN